jgi:hypothetical protein
MDIKEALQNKIDDRTICGQLPESNAHYIIE